MNARKTATLSAVLFSLAVSAGSVSAQGIRLGADIGPAFTTDEFSSNWKTGYCRDPFFYTSVSYNDDPVGRPDRL